MTIKFHGVLIHDTYKMQSSHPELYTKGVTVEMDAESYVIYDTALYIHTESDTEILMVYLADIN